MFEIGKFNVLQVVKISPTGALLASPEEDVVLPKKYLPAGIRPGDTVRVFVYRDAQDRLTATTRAPKAEAGDFAVMAVIDIAPVGAFLDWGLEKDLLVPFSEQPRPMKKGERHLVRVFLDPAGRIAASARIEKFLETENVSLTTGEEVDLIIHAVTDLGAKVIINNRYAGLLFKSELFGTPAPGQKLRGYVGKIRADRKIDVTLTRSGSQGMEQGRVQLLAALAAAGGFLPLGDKSPPEEIGRQLHMSKKSFKKAVGGLYREGHIDLTDCGIRLRGK